jgi:hypothetical protein
VRKEASATLGQAAFSASCAKDLPRAFFMLSIYLLLNFRNLRRAISKLCSLALGDKQYFVHSSMYAETTFYLIVKLHLSRCPIKCLWNWLILVKFAKLVLCQEKLKKDEFSSHKNNFNGIDHDPLLPLLNKKSLLRISLICAFRIFFSLPNGV